ncbi:hypothetical protein NQ314_010725 [Rhamnusium bicolor]|uniref:Uncharacterized protein n=1 Tax=Rhamnusium bicolor TaxID=1586634 RepID=A0AAV8XNB7_9CUCU|nr:hypothetical protein NQ314_010725 [Rhamnusium bicolor]
MENMYTHIHMKIVQRLLLMLGIWPVQRDDYKQKAYDAYFYISFSYFIVCLMTKVAVAFETIDDIIETADNLGVTIVYIICVYKVLIYHSKIIRSLIKVIEKKEKYILDSDNTEVKKNISKCSEIGASVNIVFSLLGNICSNTVYYNADP